MIKHFKSRFSSGKSSENSSKPKCNIEFFQLLKAYMRRPGIKLILNIPETIILNSPGCESVLFFSDSDSHLICQESITNEYMQRFLKRCYYYFKPPHPKVVLKANKFNFLDSCTGVSSLKECYNIWKNREHNPSYFALQRYIVPPTGELFKIRVFFNVQKSIMLFRTIKKKNLSPPSNSPEPVKGWTRLKNSNRTADLGPLDKFFVRNGEENFPYDCEMKNSVIQEQVKSIKKVIESVGCSDGSFLLLELYVDFIQDFSGTWYFLNVVNYKLEFIVNKKPSTALPKMKRRASSTIDLSVQKTKLTEGLSSIHTLQDTLINELIQDFHSTKSRKLVNSSQNLYRKAYHLKLINS